MPITPGGRDTIYVFGDNLNQVSESGLSLTSPFISVVPGSFTSGFAGGMSYVRFDAATTFSAPPGDYSIRLQSNTGEVAYVTGGLTVDLANNAPVVNQLDTVDFFVRQQYHDFLNREADDAGLQFWKGTLESYLNNCGTADTSQAADCRARARASVSEAFFVSVEFQETGYLVYRLYRAAFRASSRPPRGLPRYAEFIRDTQTIGAGVIVNQGNWQQQLEANKQAFLTNFVQRAEFTATYPLTMTADQYVNALLANAGLPLDGAEKQAALNAYGAGGVNGRARALRSIAESDLLFRKEFNQAFVLMQYFGYLRRNSDDAPDNSFAGYDFWLGKLNAESGDTTNLQTLDQLLAPTKRARMVEAFVVTGEYRRRFGPE
ncbi:MAG: hypothetical protein H0V88_08215 [Pyrinomonadaceae bacterium]|nr:hypothetical protein [Pyrinomonadaceae bacterium]